METLGVISYQINDLHTVKENAVMDAVYQRYVGRNTDASGCTREAEGLIVGR